VKTFDKKFGEHFVQSLPDTPAVYLFKDEQGEVIYAGKAKNIRRRLQNYCNASLRKAHRKMRQIVREASTLEIIPQPSERDALLLENKLIRELRPRFNLDGAYTFLYPAIGTGSARDTTLFCFTTDTAAWEALHLNWYGVFRSRLRALDAFDALVTLVALIAHIEPKAKLPDHPRIRGARLVGFRRLPAEILTSIERFLEGDSAEALGPLVEQLLEKPRARRDSTQVQEHLKQLSNFHKRDLAPLRKAMLVAGYTDHFVDQEERDALFLATDERIDSADG
jgi:predicted GIY-YIG superfamily endonuclease